MRRSLTVAAALAVAALVLAGCASHPASKPTATTDTLSGQVTVSAAASLTDVFNQIAKDFVTAHPDVHVVLNYGGSSALAQQIVQGAQVDVFAAANQSTMKTVTDASLASNPTLFATNTLQIAVPPDNPGKVTGLADFANPKLAIVLCAVAVPCGSAAAAVFADAGVTPSVDSYEQDVKSVLTKVELGEADAGMVYRTDVLAAGDKVTGIDFPEAASETNQYPIAVLANPVSPDAAKAFVAWVLSPKGQKVLSDAGFGA